MAPSNEPALEATSHDEKPKYDLEGWTYRGWKSVPANYLYGSNAEAFSFVIESWFVEMGSIIINLLMKQTGSTPSTLSMRCPI
jgi:hypothetical protein